MENATIVVMVPWHRTGGRAWWAVVVLAFLGLELVLRIKLGSIYFLAVGWAWAHQSLAERLGHEVPRPGPLPRFLYALAAALVVCGTVFAVFTFLTVVTRGIDNNIRWFQLP